MGDDARSCQASGAKGASIVRHSAEGVPLRAGDLVYRVIEVDPPPDVYEPHTWKVASAVVERASARQVKLKTRLLGLGNLVFEPSAFGRLFHAAPGDPALPDRAAPRDRVTRSQAESGRARRGVGDEPGGCEAVSYAKQLTFERLVCAVWSAEFVRALNGAQSKSGVAVQHFAEHAGS
jgi:hypothetical protein